MKKSVFLAKCLEMATRLIIYPYKVILTLFRPVVMPKPENVGLKGPTSHPSPVVKSFILFLSTGPKKSHVTLLSNRAEGDELIMNRRLATLYWTYNESLYTVTSTRDREGRCQQFCT
jgi:hypothetical protein